MARVINVVPYYGHAALLSIVSLRSENPRGNARRVLAMVLESADRAPGLLTLWAC